MKDGGAGDEVSSRTWMLLAPVAWLAGVVLLALGVGLTDNRVALALPRAALGLLLVAFARQRGRGGRDLQAVWHGWGESDGQRYGVVLTICTVGLGLGLLIAAGMAVLT